MSVRCPECAFESPDGAKWCDFCKEPFLKARPPKVPPPSYPPPPVGKPLPLEHAAIVESLASDWPAEPPPSPQSPLLRKASVAALMLLLLLAVAAGVVVLFQSGSYQGPGADIPLGAPKVINIPKKE